MSKIVHVWSHAKYDGGNVIDLNTFQVKTQKTALEQFVGGLIESLTTLNTVMNLS